MPQSIRPDAAAPILRWAEPGDADAMAVLHALAFERNWSASEIAALMSMPGGFAVLVEQDGIAGFALARAAGGEAELLTVAVAPTLRRQGLARALLDAVIAQARALEAQVIYLEVASDNPGAQALYLGAGFEQIGQRPAYYAWRDGSSADALVFGRTLNTPDR